MIYPKDSRIYLLTTRPFCIEQTNSTLQVAMVLRKDGSVVVGTSPCPFFLLRQFVEAHAVTRTEQCNKESKKIKCWKRTPSRRFTGENKIFITLSYLHLLLIWTYAFDSFWAIGYGVTANIAASHSIDRGSSGFDSPYPNALRLVITLKIIYYPRVK